MLKEAEMRVEGMKHGMEMEREQMKQQSAQLKMFVDANKADQDIRVTKAKADAAVKNADASTEESAD